MARERGGGGGERGVRVGRRGVAGGGGELGDGREGVIPRKGIEVELRGGRQSGRGEELPLERRVVGRIIHGGLGCYEGLREEEENEGPS